MLSSPLVLDFIKSAALPAFAVALAMLFTGWLREPWKAKVQALAIALGFAAGDFLLIGRLQFPPSDVNEAFTWSAFALALFVAISPRGINSRYLIRALFVVALGALAFWPLKAQLHTYVNMRNLLAFFFLGLGTWSILEKAAAKCQLLTMVVLPLITATAVTLTFMFKGSASMAQILSVLCTILGAISVLALIFPTKVSAAAFLPFVSIFVVLFMAAGHFYLDINPWYMIYLCVPFLMLWIRGSIPFVPRKPIPEAVILGLISAAPLAYFVWDVIKHSDPLY